MTIIAVPEPAGRKNARTPSLVMRRIADNRPLPA
jgi:hypothetical protein